MFGWMRVLTSRIHGWFSAREIDEEFLQELDAHLELLTEQNVHRGMTPEEARRYARLRLGGIAQLREMHRELGGLPVAETFFQDVRYALRILLFLIIAIVCLSEKIVPVVSRSPDEGEIGPVFVF